MRNRTRDRSADSGLAGLGLDERRRPVEDPADLGRGGAAVCSALPTVKDILLLPGRRDFHEAPGVSGPDVGSAVRDGTASGTAKIPYRYNVSERY